jgi:hypothetical protein
MKEIRETTHDEGKDAVLGRAEKEALRTKS